MKKLFAILFLSICATYLFADIIEVAGYVYDMKGTPIASAVVTEKNTSNYTTTDLQGHFKLKVRSSKAVLVCSHPDWQVVEVKASNSQPLRITLLNPSKKVAPVMDEIMMERIVTKAKINEGAFYQAHWLHAPASTNQDTEEYASIQETGFKNVTDAPLSTFSIDVDAASYSNVRRFLMNGQMPPKDAIRIEEMINYFDYSYAAPKDGQPFAIHTGLMQAPWQSEHLLARIALKGMEIETKDLPPSNLVFLIDVSGSMEQANKLPLLRSSFKLLINQLRAVDKVSIVVYAGAAGLVLPPTAGNDHATIMAALDKLSAGGSTAGGAGIRLAYQTAKENFIKGGNNRVILASDGDFNVGESSNQTMEKLIEEKRNEGVFLTVLGYGMGNYKDAKMEILADKGNGNYAYIDNMTEAYKVLVSEFGGTLYTIAKDVKLQVEFNPAYVKAYRLIGYENRRLKDEDFNNDKKDAGDLGSGHTVTALYEIVPVGAKSNYPGAVDPLKYQQNKENLNLGAKNGELLTVKFRYKDPNDDKSKLISRTLENRITPTADENMQWATAVACFGLLLSDSEYVNDIGYDKVLAMAKSAKGADEKGYRAEFIKLIELAKSMTPVSGE